MREGAAMRIFKDCRFVLALGYALLMIPTAGFGASSLGHALRQNAGQGSSGGGQQQSPPQTRPAQRPQGGKPGDRPTIQPVPQPGLRLINRERPESRGVRSSSRHPRDQSRVNRDIARHDRRMAGRRTCNRVRHANGARMIGTPCSDTIAGILVTSTARADRYL
jgi:hypothetical protein